MPPQDRNDKLNAFLKECLMFGCLKGFKHFFVYPRGREELLLTVKVDPSAPRKLKTEADDVESATDVIFLIGAYTRYKCPYVWVRSHHTILPSGKPVESKDTPLDLHTTSSWKTGNIHIWDIVQELVPLAFSSPVHNPFELDRNPLPPRQTSISTFPTTMPDLNTFLAYGALANFLRKVYLANYPFAELRTCSGCLNSISDPSRTWFQDDYEIRGQNV